MDKRLLAVLFVATAMLVICVNGIKGEDGELSEEYKKECISKLATYVTKKDFLDRIPSSVDIRDRTAYRKLSHGWMEYDLVPYKLPDNNFRCSDFLAACESVETKVIPCVAELKENGVDVYGMAVELNPKAKVVVAAMEGCKEAQPDETDEEEDECMDKLAPHIKDVEIPEAVQKIVKWALEHDGEADMRTRNLKNIIKKETWSRAWTQSNVRGGCAKLSSQLWKASHEVECIRKIFKKRGLYSRYIGKFDGHYKDVLLAYDVCFFGTTILMEQSGANFENKPFEPSDKLPSFVRYFT